MIGSQNKKKKKINYQLLILASPGLLLLFTFYIIPMFGLFIPFKNIDYAKGIFKSDWCGFDNFNFFFKSQDFIRITRNTLLLNLMFITVGISLAVIVAIILYGMTKRKVKLFQTSIFLPYFVSWIVVSYILYALINSENGLIPMTYQNITGDALDSIYTNAKLWPGILLVANVWKGIGYNALLFYTTLIGMDTTYIEAAVIDGASKMQRIRYILLPYITPTLIMLTMLSLGRIFFADFGMFYSLTKNSGALYQTVDVIDTYVYRALVTNGNLGMVAAVGLYQSVCGLILLFIANVIVRKIAPENAIF